VTLTGAGKVWWLWRIRRGSERARGGGGAGGGKGECVAALTLALIQP